MANRKIDILDILPEDAIKEVDKLGYTFLTEQGFDAEGAIESASKRTKLKKALARQGKELRYAGAVDNETKAILVWYELYQGKERIAVSQGIKFLPKPPEGGTGGE